MERVVQAPPAPVNNHAHTGAFIRRKCHKMQQAAFAKPSPPPCSLGGGVGRDQGPWLLCRASLPAPCLQSLLLGSLGPSSCPAAAHRTPCPICCHPHPGWVRTCMGQALPAVGDMSCLQPVPGVRGEVLVPHQHRGVEAEDLPKLGVCLCSGHHRAEARARLGGRTSVQSPAWVYLPSDITSAGTEERTNPGTEMLLVHHMFCWATQAGHCLMPRLPAAKHPLVPSSPGLGGPGLRVT